MKWKSWAHYGKNSRRLYWTRSVPIFDLFEDLERISPSWNDTNDIQVGYRAMFRRLDKLTRAMLPFQWARGDCQFVSVYVSLSPTVCFSGLDSSVMQISTKRHFQLEVLQSAGILDTRLGPF